MIAQRLGLVQDGVRNADLAHVVEQEAELDLGVLGQRRARRPRELQPVRGHAFGVASGVGITGLDRIAQRPHGEHVGATQGVRALPLGLERLAQVGGVALELALLGARLDLSLSEL